MSSDVELQLRPGDSNPSVMRMVETRFTSRRDGVNLENRRKKHTYPSSLLDDGGLGAEPAKLGGGDSVTS